MDVRDLVRDHYGGFGLAEAVLATLAGAGVDVEHLQASDLFPVDHLHGGGAPATAYALDKAQPGPGTRFLDVGCGLGGPCRMAAQRGATVTGVDLTPEFVEAATDLTARVGLADRATYVVTSGDSLPLGDGSFDAASLMHVGMNVPDKQAVFAEVHRVLVPGGTFVVFEQMAGDAEGELDYPMPWADDARSSFVETEDAYRGHLEAAGFTVVEVEDRTEAAGGPPPAGGVSQADVFGETFREAIGNFVAATRAGRLRTVLLVATA